MTLSIGDFAPQFCLPGDKGDTITLSSLLGKKIILYFYPKDDTPGCTQEACDFRDHLSELQAEGAMVIGISKDTLRCHEEFKIKYQLSFSLLSDEDAQVCQAYEVWRQKLRDGLKYMGIERTTFLIDPQGIIRKIWRNVKVEKHIEEVLEAVRSLAKQA